MRISSASEVNEGIMYGVYTPRVYGRGQITGSAKDASASCHQIVRNVLFSYINVVTGGYKFLEKKFLVLQPER